jgi:hypothetical protein
MAGLIDDEQASFVSDSNSTEGQAQDEVQLGEEVEYLSREPDEPLQQDEQLVPTEDVTQRSRSIRPSSRGLIKLWLTRRSGVSERSGISEKERIRQRLDDSYRRTSRPEQAALEASLQDDTTHAAPAGDVEAVLKEAETGALAQDLAAQPDAMSEHHFPTANTATEMSAESLSEPNFIRVERPRQGSL